MAHLKALSRDAIPRALEKAERYRLLNEPGEAESICLDVLSIDPENQQALVALLLARTDQFAEHDADEEAAREVLPRLKDAYKKAYYAGIISERRAKGHLKRARPGSGFAAYQDLQRAMSAYQQAEALRPPGNDDALLRWNACVRFLASHPSVAPREEDRTELPLE
jgi:hypothetical protein